MQCLSNNVRARLIKRESLFSQMALINEKKSFDKDLLDIQDTNLITKICYFMKDECMAKKTIELTL